MDGEALTLMLVNKSRKPTTVTLPGGLTAAAVHGFDTYHPTVQAMPTPAGSALTMPARSARLVVMA